MDALKQSILPPISRAAGGRRHLTIRRCFSLHGHPRISRARFKNGKRTLFSSGGACCRMSFIKGISRFVIRYTPAANVPSGAFGDTS